MFLFFFIRLSFHGLTGYLFELDTHGEISLICFWQGEGKTRDEVLCF